MRTLPLPTEQARNNLHLGVAWMLTGPAVEDADDMLVASWEVWL